MGFGRDYARHFLELEGTIDFEEVVKKYTFRELTDRNSSENLKKQEAAIQEIRQRIGDACIFNHIVLDEEPDIEFFVPMDADGLGWEDMEDALGAAVGDNMAAAATEVARD